MDELIERIRKTLKDSYGIASGEELVQAMEEQKRADIGIFLMDCGMEDNNVEKAS